MTSAWGRPIEVNGVRPTWLPDDVVCGAMSSYTREWYAVDLKARDWAWSPISHIRLPADSPVYRALDARFEPWLGGDTAPGDWDDGEVLWASGDIRYPGDWRHLPRYGYNIIIGYRKRTAEATATIARMTESEAKEWSRNMLPGADQALRRLGLIREESRVERFKAANPNWNLMPRDELIEAALRQARH